MTTENTMMSRNDGYWVLPENIDTNKFDFSWKPSIYEPPYIHQFGTQHQKTGGPRYVCFGATEVKYNNSQIAVRLANKFNYRVNMDIVPDSFDFSWHPDDTEPAFIHVFGNNLFNAEECPTIEYHVPGATEHKFHNEKRATLLHKQLDIIFISNGETGAEDRYQHLCRAARREVKRVDGVKGREVALRKAAELSETEWFIAVPAKLRINPKFDFNWQPNRYLGPKHYIFYAENPINGLMYGHQAAVAYHKDLVLATNNYGLDFTMSKPHDVVPVNSGIAEFNSDKLMTWRTAFREAIKLMLDVKRGSQESAKRLDTWLTVGHGDFAEYSKLGAKQGVDYFNEVRGEPLELQLSFGWEWLQERYTKTVDIE